MAAAPTPTVPLNLVLKDDTDQTDGEGHVQRSAIRTLHKSLKNIYINQRRLKRKTKRPKKMRREAYHRRLKYHQSARNLLLLLVIIIISTNTVVAEGVSPAANLRIVSNASSLVADYMEVDGGDWEIGGMLVYNNHPKSHHIVYPVTGNRGPLCHANKYQSCLPSPNHKGPRSCRSCYDRVCK